MSRIGRITRCRGCGCDCRKRRRGPSYCEDCQLAEDEWNIRAEGRRDPDSLRHAGRTICLQDDADKKELKQDLQLLERAVRERWPIGNRKRRALIERLAGIVEKKALTVPVGGGEFLQFVELEGPADANAIQAGRVLVQMVAQNQTDEETAAKLSKPDTPAPAANVQVNVGVQNNVSVTSLAQELLNQPEFLEFERKRAMEEDRDPGPVRTGGK